MIRFNRALAARDYRETAANGARAAGADKNSRTRTIVRDSCDMNPAARPPAIICDVDGTLCDVRNIRHHVERPAGVQGFRPNFALFHAASEDCPAFSHVVQLTTNFERDGYAIVVVTAREARWTDLTERWLSRHGVQRAELFTRRALDYRSDALVKAEICSEIQSRYVPHLAIDDRDDILAVWTAASIPTIKIDQTGFPSSVSWPSAAHDDRLGAVVEAVRRTRATDVAAR